MKLWRQFWKLVNFRLLDICLTDLPPFPPSSRSLYIIDMDVFTFELTESPVPLMEMFKGALEVSAVHSSRGCQYVKLHCCLPKKTKASTAPNVFTANHVLSQWTASEPFIWFFFICIFVDEIWVLSLSDEMTAAARANYCVFLSFITKNHSYCLRKH